MKGKPKISIITINFNDIEGLKSTFNSVAKQTFRDFEFIIIDGGSEDGSKQFIEENQSKLSYWVSEKDKGVFHAMNKGIEQAVGDYLYFLNSGDEFYENITLEKVVLLLNENCRIYYGDVQRIFKDGTRKIKKYPNELSFQFFYGSALAHQTSFVERTVFDEVFRYNEEFKIFGDWAFFLCAICKHNIEYKHLGLVVANYGMDGVSSNPENRKKYQIERIQTYETYFPSIYKDYERMKGRLTYRHDLFHKLNSNNRTKKLTYICLRIINKFFYKKK